MSTQNTIKLQAFLAQAGVASRRKAEELIAAGQVKVNGQVAHVGQRVEPSVDQISVNGKTVSSKAEHYYYLINKPVGYVSTTNDELQRRTVLDIIPKLPGRLYPVGRLDQESEGLMLLTNDGELAYKLTHPKFEVEKTYQVTLDRDISSKALEHLEKGVRLKDGFTKPKRVALTEPDRFDLLNMTITEGRNRQVRRMLERVGYEVLKLVRIQLGPFSLGSLNNQQYKKLSAEEVKFD